jgi:hypothetical protein
MFIKGNHQSSFDLNCFPSREVAKQVFWIALPVVYLPAIFLVYFLNLILNLFFYLKIFLFLRISLVVHRHLKFLREHSSLSHLGPPSTIQQQQQPLLSPIKNNNFQINFEKKIEKTNDKINGKRASS